MTPAHPTVPATEAPRRLLIVRTGAMGDILHTLHAVAALRRERPHWQIDWVVDPRWAPLLVDVDGARRGPIVSGIHLADTRLWSRSPFSLATFHSIRKLRRELRAERYDLVVDMQGTLRSAFIGRMARAPVFAGYATPRERQAAWFYTRKLPRIGIHIVEMNAALLGQAVNLPLAPSRVELPVEGWAAAWAAEEAASGKLCILTPAAGWGAKRWPAANFGALAQRLKALGYDVVVTAGRKDDALAAEVLAASGDCARLVVCNVSGLLALTRRAALAVGGDSGPIHLAAALGVPLVALFGPTDPARNGPWRAGPSRVLRDPSSTTSHRRIDQPDPGLSRISVEQVLAAVDEVSGDHPPTVQSP